MNKELHRKRHVRLHYCLDELVADWVTHTDGLPSKNTVLDLIKWSHVQTEDPTGPHGDEKEL